MSYAAEIARSVKRYDAADHEALRRFQHTQFGGDTRHSDDAFCDWLFERNPHRSPAGPSLWVCKRDGVVVGQQASIPTVLKIDDLEQRAAWLVDWVIDPQWRLRGVAPALLAANMGDYELMLGLGLEDNAYKTVSRSGWEDVGRLSLFVRPLEPDACAQVLNLPRAVARLVPRLVMGGSARAIGGTVRQLMRVALEPTLRFDERIDSVWRATKRDYPILVKRDFASVRWRYDDGPYARLYQRYYVTRRGQTLGYAVLRLATWRGQLIARVVDYLVPRDNVGSLFALLMEAASVQGAIAVFFEQWLAGATPALRSIGCIRARTSHRFMFRLKDAASPLGTPLRDAARWFLVLGDSDFDFVVIDSLDKPTAPALRVVPTRD